MNESRIFNSEFLLRHEYKTNIEKKSIVHLENSVFAFYFIDLHCPYLEIKRSFRFTLSHGMFHTSRKKTKPYGKFGARYSKLCFDSY